MRISDWSSDVCSSDLLAKHLSTVENSIFQTPRLWPLSVPTVDKSDDFQSLIVLSCDADAIMASFGVTETALISLSCARTEFSISRVSISVVFASSMVFSLHNFIVLSEQIGRAHV